MAATKQAGALSALKVKPMYGEAVDEDDDVDEAMRRVMDAYTARQQRNYDPTLMAIGQGLLASKGNFGEAVGMAAKSYEDMQAKLRQEEIDTSAANLQLAQSRRDQALMRKRTEAGSNLWGGTSGAGAADESVDQDAVSFLEAQGVPRKQATNLLTQGGISPNQKVRDGGFDMSAGLAKYGEYVRLYGSDDQSKAFLEALKLQNDRYALQNGMRMDKASGRVDFVEPAGLPQPGDKNIDLFIGGGTRKVDQRTAMLYEFAQNQGPEVAKAFAESYIKNGTVPKDIVDKYKAQQSGAAGVAGGAEISPERLDSILTALEMKSTGVLSPIPLVGEDAGKRPPLNKEVKFNPQEAKVMAAMFRIGNAQVAEQPETSLSPFDRQVLAAFRARAKQPVPLAGASEVEKAAAAPAAVVPVAAAAAPAAAVVPVKAAPAAVVPAAKAAEAPAKAAAAPAAAVVPAAAPAARKPVLPLPVAPAGLPANPSAEDRLAYEARKATADAEYKAKLEQYKLEMEQYNKELNRPADVEANVEEAERKKQNELALTDEQTFLKSLNTSRQMKTTSLRVLDNVIKNPNAVGLLADPGLFNAVGSLVADGISLGNTTIKLADAETALAKVMPGVTKEDLQRRAEISKDLAEIELLYTREFLSGQGAVTEGERKIVRSLGGTVSDSPTVLARRIELMIAKAKYNQDKVMAFQDWKKDKTKSKGLTINDWMSSPEARKIDADYDKTTNSLYNKFFNKPAATTSSGEAVPPQLKSAKEALLESLKRK